MSKKNAPKSKADRAKESQKYDAEFIKNKKLEIQEKLRKKILDLSKESANLTKPFAVGSAQVNLLKKVKDFTKSFNNNIKKKLEDLIAKLPKQVRGKISKQINANRLIEKLAKKTTITITGVASMEGDLDRNKELALRRAEATKKALLKDNPKIKDLFNIQTKGVVYGPNKKPITDIEKAKKELVNKWNKDIAGDDESKKVNSAREIYAKMGQRNLPQKQAKFIEEHFTNVRKAMLSVKVDGVAKKAKKAEQIDDTELNKKYDKVREPKNGRRAVKKGKKWGFIDESGKEVVEPKYDKVWGFQKNGRAGVKKDGKWGFIDENGKEVVKPKYDYVWDFKNGRAKAQKGDKYFFININGDMVSKKYDSMTDSHEGRRAVKKDGKWGFVDESGKEVVKPKYDKVWYFQNNGRAVVKKGQKELLINKNGKEISKKYDEIWGFQKNGRARVKKDGKFGLVDESGKEIVEPKYDYVWVFQNNGRAVVKKDGKWGFVDKSGKEVVKPKYDQVWYFNKQGIAIVKNDKKYFFININGEVVSKKYDSMTDSHEGRRAVKKGGKWGFVDNKGKEIVPPIYNEVERYKDGQAKVTMGAGPLESSFYIDKRGNPV
jgi:hypothetical protein